MGEVADGAMPKHVMLNMMMQVYVTAEIYLEGGLEELGEEVMEEMRKTALKAPTTESKVQNEVAGFLEILDEGAVEEEVSPWRLMAKEGEIGGEAERRAKAGAKRWQKLYTAFLRNEQHSSLRSSQFFLPATVPCFP